MSDKLSQFANQKYLSVESYRKNGTPVATPVWFAEEAGKLYIYSLADAGKVKRIRNNPRVRIVPCDFRGTPKGEWIEASARIIDEAGSSRVHKLLNQKYGLVKRIGNFYSRLMNRKRAVIAIDPGR